MDHQEILVPLDPQELRVIPFANFLDVDLLDLLAVLILK